MQDVKAPAGEWRIGDFFVANDKLETAVHGDCPRSTMEGTWRRRIQVPRMVDDSDMGS
jgi:hypothetical protein